MITYEEYNRIQELLWDSWKTKLVKHEFSYTWIIRCWECNSMIVAWHKNKYMRLTNTIKKYSYYRCTKRNKSIVSTCSQKAITLEKLEKQIDHILWSIEIVEEFKLWAIDILKVNLKEDIELIKSNYEQLEKDLNKTEFKLNKLTDMVLEWKIDDTIYDK